MIIPGFQNGILRHVPLVLITLTMLRNRILWCHASSQQHLHLQTSPSVYSLVTLCQLFCHIFLLCKMLLTIVSPLFKPSIPSSQMSPPPLTSLEKVPSSLFPVCTILAKQTQPYQPGFLYLRENLSLPLPGIVLSIGFACRSMLAVL